MYFSYRADSPSVSTEFVGFAKRPRSTEDTELIDLSNDQVFPHRKLVEWIEDGNQYPISDHRRRHRYNGIESGDDSSGSDDEHRTIRLRCRSGRKDQVDDLLSAHGRPVHRQDIARAATALWYSDANPVSTPENWSNNDLIPGEVIMPAPREYESAMERRGMGKECYDWWFCRKKCEAPHRWRVLCST